MAFAPGVGRAQGSPPDAKPAFVPGLYDTETRTSGAQRQTGIRRKICIAFADTAAFQRETIARYLTLPQFKQACTLSPPKPLPDGFAFAMDCGDARTLNAYHFAKDLVTSTTQTKIASRPEYASTMVTLSRRIGNCLVGP